MAGRFGELLRLARLRAGRTQERLAEEAGLSARTIRRLEAGRSANPVLETVRRIADALGLQPAEREALLSAALHGMYGMYGAPAEDQDDARGAGGDTVGSGGPGGAGCDDGGGPAQAASVTARVPRELPAAPGGFVGRGAELAALDLAMGADEGGAVVVSAATGGGGIGKTWLALVWAHRNADRFPDGQLFCDLRGYAPNTRPIEPSEALRGFLDALGVAPDAVPLDVDARAKLYRTLLAGRRMLVVLDNGRDTAQVAPLLTGGDSCRVIVTSRDRLAGLVAGHNARPLPLGTLDEARAWELLAARLGEDRLVGEPEAAMEILACCGGLPLALAVVAARAAVHPDQPLARLAAELRDTAGRLDALDAGDPVANVPATLLWTLHAVEPHHAEVFGLLGLNPGPDIGLPAATALTGLPERQARAALRALERLHLAEQRGPGRWAMHDLVKLTAAHHARTMPEPDRDQALRRLADHYLHTAAAADRLFNPTGLPIQLPDPPDRARPRALADRDAALVWFDAEHPNLIAAQRLAVERRWHAHTWQLAWATQSYLWHNCRVQDYLAIWQAGLTAAEQEEGYVARAVAHHFLGRAHVLAGRHNGAVRHLHQALELAEHANDLTVQVYTHLHLGPAWELREDYLRGLEHAIRALSLAQALDDPVPRAFALNNVGYLLALLGRYDEARAHCEAALELWCLQDASYSKALTLDSLGYIAHHSGQPETALERYREALDLYRDFGSVHAQPHTLDHLALSYHALGQHEQARRHWQEALALFHDQHRDADAERVQTSLDALGAMLESDPL